jgi:hypothetical protein
MVSISRARRLFCSSLSEETHAALSNFGTAVGRDEPEDRPSVFADLGVGAKKEVMERVFLEEVAGVAAALRLRFGEVIVTKDEEKG